MLQAYFESIKYVGHLLPISLLRIFVGYFYLQQAVADWKMHILSNSTVSDMIVDALSSDKMPYWYRIFLSEHVIPHWNIYAFIFVGLQLTVGLSYLIGYVVRPASIIGLILCLNYIAVGNSQQELFFRMMIACQVTFMWVGAGRCLGLDYFFYKRYRGIWW